MKRALLYLPLCLVVFYVLGVRHVRKKHKERKQQQEQSSHQHSATWQEFSQEKHFQMLVEGFGIGSMLDIPSRDVEHMHLPLKKYIGVAPTPAEAANLQTRFGSAISSFISLDLTIDPLPKVDLILCWDRFSSLSDQEIRAALLQCKKSGAKFLLLSHCPSLKQNEEEEYRQINWKLSPYNFPEPLIMMVEKANPEPQYLGLWNLAELP